MRMLLEVNFPHEPFNQSVRDGTAGAKLDEIIESLSPEAVYFTERGGHRAALVVVAVDDPARIPSFAEPFFLHFGADVHLRAAMTPEDLKKADLPSLGKHWSGR